jgi:hypothetical protein
MKTNRRPPSLVVRCVVVAVLTAFGGAARAQSQCQDLTVNSPALQGNLLGDPAARTIRVCTPPSYSSEPQRRYPVQYLLPGTGGNETYFFADGYPNALALGFDALGNPKRPHHLVLNLDAEQIANDIFAAEEAAEAITVAVTGLTSTAGSLYWCSDVIGDHRTFVAENVVSAVDSQFRTVPDRHHRAIIGHSMGGFGALSLGMEYRNTFGAVAVIEPAFNDLERKISPSDPLPRYLFLQDLIGCPNPAVTTVTSFTGPMSDAELWGLMGTVTSAGDGTFFTNVFRYLGQAFSPDPTNPPSSMETPFDCSTHSIIPGPWALWTPNDLVSQLQTGYGNLKHTPLYLAKASGAPVVHASVSDIVATKVALDDLGVIHTYEEFPNTDHFTILPEALRNAMVFVLNNMHGNQNGPGQPDATLRIQHAACAVNFPR